MRRQAMDALIIFGCLFVPLFGLELLSAGRDLLLFRPRHRMRLGITGIAGAAALAAMLAIGMPPSWAAALVLAGPSATLLGHWVGSGDWIVAEHRVRSALRHLAPGH